MYWRTMVVPRQLRAVFVVVAISLFSPVAQALGIGELKVYSALDEPLSAEIPLIPTGSKETKTLQARLVPRPDFDVAADATAPVSGEVSVKVTQLPGGQYVLKLYSERPVREPYLRFLLQLDWAGGRLTREFVALIDPRDFSPARSTGAQEAEAENAPALVADTGGVAEQPTSPPVAATGASPESAADGAAPQADAASPAAGRPDNADPAPSTPGSEPAATVRNTPATQKTKPEAAVVNEPPKSKKPNADEQRERLASEIKAWAKTQEQIRPKDKAASSDVNEPAKEQAAESETAQAPAATSAASGKRDSGSEKAAGVKRSVAPTVTADTPLLQWTRENAGRLLMVLLALLALLAGTIGAAWATLYAWRRWRPREYPRVRYGERRRREGRRRQFLPVAIERRRGPRRDSDRVISEVGVVHAGDGYDEDVGHLETDTEEPTERVLHKAIATHPQQHSLKVKLLGLYYQQNNKQAFESLLNRLYADLVEVPDPERQVASAFDELVQQSLAEQRQDDKDVPKDDRDEPSVLTGIATGHTRYPLPEEDIREAVTIVPHGDPMAPEDGIPVLSFGEEPNRTSDRKDAEPKEPNIDKGLDWENGKDLTAKDSDVIRKGGTAQDKSEDSAKDDNDAGLEQLSLDDLIDIGSADGDGLLDSIEFEHVDLPDEPVSGKGGTRSKGKNEDDKENRGRRKKSSAKKVERRRQWRDPAIKIDLAKAYIDMGDPERARHILDEVLANWHRGDGTDG